MTDYIDMSDSEKKKEDWMNSKWRPMMGWLYMATCTFDFVIFPIFWSMLQSIMGHPITQWQPLTLQGAGLYHIAMGAVLGLTAFGRTQEKIAGVNNSGTTTATASIGLPSATPSNFQTSVTPSVGTTISTNSVSGSGNGGIPKPATSGSVMQRSGKLGPAEEPMPEL